MANIKRYDDYDRLRVVLYCGAVYGDTRVNFSQVSRVLGYGRAFVEKTWEGYKDGEFHYLGVTEEDIEDFKEGYWKVTKRQLAEDVTYVSRLILEQFFEKDKEGKMVLTPREQRDVAYAFSLMVEKTLLLRGESPHGKNVGVVSNKILVLPPKQEVSYKDGKIEGEVGGMELLIEGDAE